MFINRTSFLLLILTLHFYLFFLLKIVDFEKISLQWDFIGFPKFTGSYINFQNGGLQSELLHLECYNFLILIGFSADCMV